MRAALALLGATSPGRAAGASPSSATCWNWAPRAPALHAGLAADLEANRVDLLFGAGPLTRALYDAAPAAMRARCAPSAPRACASRCSRRCAPATS